MPREHLLHITFNLCLNSSYFSEPSQNFKQNIKSSFSTFVSDQILAKKKRPSLKCGYGKTTENFFEILFSKKVSDDQNV